MPFRSATKYFPGALIFALLLSLVTTSALAWTDKTVRLLVPAPPGGSIDVVARIIADQLAKDLRVPVVVENKPGAGGAIAVQTMLSAPADGSVLLATTSNVLTEIPHVMKSSFDPLKDIVPIAPVAMGSIVLVSNLSVPAKDLKGLVAWAKANPGKLSIASYSAGTISHYAGMMLNSVAGLDLQHVPFPGSPPAMTSLIGGQVPLMFNGLAAVLPMVRAGKIRAYAVCTPQRSKLLPDVPTMKELGYANFEFGNWFGVVGSSKLSPDLVQKINTAILKVAANPTVRGRLQTAGNDFASPQTPAQMEQSVRAEYARNAEIVKKFNITLN